MELQSREKKIFGVLLALCILGAAFLIPYLHFVGILPPGEKIWRWRALLFSMLQATFIFGLSLWFSFMLLPKTDLQPFRYQSLFKQIVFPAAVWGAFVGFAIFFTNQYLFAGAPLIGAYPLHWVAALASLYGAVNEEVLCRLFFFTLFYFLIGRVVPIREKNRTPILWSVNLLVALLFGAAHLPLTFATIPDVSAFDVFRVFFLNAIGGLVFGWLYWSRGLWTAMAAHLVADLVIHVVLY